MPSASPCHDQLLHLGRVADQRVVVQPLQDLFVRHPVPRSRSLLLGMGRSFENHDVAQLFSIVEL